MFRANSRAFLLLFFFFVDTHNKNRKRDCGIFFLLFFLSTFTQPVSSLFPLSPTTQFRWQRECRKTVVVAGHNKKKKDPVIYQQQQQQQQQQYKVRGASLSAFFFL